jgi:hypothetical protein
LHAKKYIKYKVISQASRVKCTRTRPEAEFLDVVGTKVLRVFLLAYSQSPLLTNFTEPNQSNARKQAIAVTQATTVTLATSNNKDDSSKHQERKQATSRNESNIRAANTIWTPAKAEMLATACREANYSRDTVKIRDDSSSSREVLSVSAVRGIMRF